MGFRFHRSIKILPGIRLNIGKRGVSTSIGVRGAHVTIGHGKVRETVSVAGSGLSYTHTSSTRKAVRARQTPARVIYRVAPVEREGLAKSLLVIMAVVLIAAGILQHL